MNKPVPRPTLQVISLDTFEVEAAFYVKNGKVYIGLGLIDMTVPMIGGGECVSADLKERAELLKNLIVRFPR